MIIAHSIHCFCLGLGLLLVTGLEVFAQQSAPADPLDWPNWRGPQQNRVSTEKGLIESWDPEGGEGSNLLWKSAEMAGRSSPIVLRGKVYTIVRDQPESETEGEKVVCADAATGEIIWQYRFNVYLSDVPDTRIGWSCLAGDPETGRIYCQGVSGYFCCLEGDSGKLVWDRSLHEELGLISTYGGRTNVPFVFEDTVLVNAVVVGWGDEPKWGGLARPAHRYMGFDKATGELRWLNGTGISPFDTTYSTPTVMPIGGQQAAVFSSGDGEVWAIQPRTGKHIWHYPFSRAGINVSPLVAPDGRVYASHSEENMFGNSMGSVVALDGTKSGDLTGTELWQHLQVMAGKSSPVLYDGRLYVVDDRAKMFIYDAKSGELVGRKALGSVMRSTPLVADGKIYLCTNNGQWWILRPTQRGVEEVHKLRLSGDENDGSPIVSHGRIYLPTSQAMYCLALPDQKPSADPIPPQPKEDPVIDKTPAVAQVIPYDILLKPGAEQSYRVRVFNARGQHLRDVPASEVKFAVDGPGTITPDGKYKAPSDVGHECALVTCKVGRLAGSGRVRITPPLPWNFDFNEAQNVPLTWIGGRVRWEVRQGDGGDKYIAKKTVLPTPKDPKNKLGTRSFVWMGPIDLNNYTIQGDVLLTEVDGRISDVGLINSRYQLTIRGRNKKLRLDSWPPSDFRAQAQADFEPQPGTWYTMKLAVSAEADKAICRGKIWQRDASEPADWTVEMTDHAPNLQGTPGVYGNTPDAEVYLDNVRVTPNS